MRRRIAQVMALTVTAVGLSVVGYSTPAMALPCGVSGPDVDNNSYGKYFLRSVSLRNGPDWSCDVIGTATTANTVDYHCFVIGETGTWTYLRTATNRYGWVWDEYLQNNGSQVHCSNG